MPSLAEIILQGGRLRSDAVREAAQIEADRRRQSGAIWGNAVKDIGQQVGQGVKAWQQEKRDAPIRADEAKLRGQNLSLNEVKLDDAQRDAEERRLAGIEKQRTATAARIYSSSWTKRPNGEWYMDQDKVAAGFEAAGLAYDPASLGPQLEAINKANTAVWSARTAYFSEAAKGVTAAGNTLESFALAIEGAERNEHIRPEVATMLLKRATENPQIIGPMMAQLSGAAAERPLVTKPGDIGRDPADPSKVLFENPETPPKPPNPPAVGSFEDYVTQKFGPRPTAEQIASARVQYGEAGRAPQITINTGGDQAALAPDPDSQNILSQTGLSMNAFFHLTGRSSQLPRDARTRNAAAQEAQAWARNNNVDIATLPSQYKTYNDVLSGNIARLNNTKIMESELEGTIENLQSVVKDSDLGQLRVANVVKVWAGQEVNDSLAQQYALHLSQLRNELSAYYAATQGRTGNNITMQDQRDAEMVIRSGISKGSLDGLRDAVKNSTGKMDTVMTASVERARKQVWNLFGVGKNYPSPSPDTKKLSAEDLIKKYGGGGR